MIIRPVIYNYNSLDAYLRDEHLWRVSQEPDFSIRKWAKKLDLADPGTLGRILSGKRIPTSRLLLQLGIDIGLTSEEGAYFELLSAKEFFTEKSFSILASSIAKRKTQNL